MCSQLFNVKTVGNKYSNFQIAKNELVRPTLLSFTILKILRQEKERKKLKPKKKGSNSVTKILLVVPLSTAWTLYSAAPNFPFKTLRTTFDESFLVYRNDYIVQIHPLCSTIDCGKVPYRLLFATTVDIEAHFS